MPRLDAELVEQLADAAPRPPAAAGSSMPGDGSRSMRSSSAISGVGGVGGPHVEPEAALVHGPERGGRGRRPRARRWWCRWASTTTVVVSHGGADFGTRFWKNDLPPGAVGVALEQHRPAADGAPAAAPPPPGSSGRGRASSPRAWGRTPCRGATIVTSVPSTSTLIDSATRPSVAHDTVDGTDRPIPGRLVPGQPAGHLDMARSLRDIPGIEPHPASASSAGASASCGRPPRSTNLDLTPGRCDSTEVAAELLPASPPARPRHRC